MINLSPMRDFFILGTSFLATCLAIAAQAADRKTGPHTGAVNFDHYQRVVHVCAATGDDVLGDGSVTKPFASLIHALEQAGRPSADARVALLIAQGNYAGPTIALKTGVDLYGGFLAPGGERDIHRFATRLDGGEANRIAFAAGDSRLDGLWFVNGRVRGKGAALHVDGGTPVITNCIFVNNRTLIPSGWDPPLLHETANDGGAIACFNGAAPRIEHCLFYDNSTECGRGAAVSAVNSAPALRNNVFANNRAGLTDPMRSSDGGAVSFFNHSSGVFSGNVVVANEALTKNDAGGVFVALWSEPLIEDNVIVANTSGDDAGGLFLGGQEHRYDAPLDAYPPADEFNIRVMRNVFVGNANGARNSGAMRVTMESRAQFSHNLITENAGGFYLQRSEIDAARNTIWQDWKFVEDKPSLGPSRFAGNILKGPAGPIEARVTFEHNMAENSVPGGPHLAVSDVFQPDGVFGELTELTFDPLTCTTTVTTQEALPAGVALAGRPIRLGDNPNGGQWRVVARAGGNEIVLWGRLEAVTKAPKYFSVLRTFTLNADAPANVGAVLK